MKIYKSKKKNFFPWKTARDYHEMDGNLFLSRNFSLKYWVARLETSDLVVKQHTYAHTHGMIGPITRKGFTLVLDIDEFSFT